MRTTVLFLALLALTSLCNAQKAFDHVKSLLVNFKANIQQEQHAADVRNEKDKIYCKTKINEAVKLVASRQYDVDELKKHIKALKAEKRENEHDKKTRENRLVANKKMLETFKKERCDNNLLFVKQLREHMEAIDIMGLLRKDINEYFANRKNKKLNRAFIERFTEFSHLLSEEQRAVFVELEKTMKNIADTDIEGNVGAFSGRADDRSKVRSRTAAEVGTEHNDNTRGELKKLAHVGHTEVAEFTDKLHKRLIVMIDGLINHLRESRNTLTKNEIRAAEDFAIFQTNMEKENEYLKIKIVELTKRIQDLSNQLNVAMAQLVKREKLLKTAQEEERTIRRICKEKKDYYRKETKRRTGEIEVVNTATNLFNSVLAKKHTRVKARVGAHRQGGKFGQKLSAHVRRSRRNIQKGYGERRSSRNKIAY